MWNTCREAACCVSSCLLQVVVWRPLCKFRRLWWVLLVFRCVALRLLRNVVSLGVGVLLAIVVHVAILAQVGGDVECSFVFWVVNVAKVHCAMFFAHSVLTHGHEHVTFGWRLKDPNALCETHACFGFKITHTAKNA